MGISNLTWDEAKALLEAEIEHLNKAVDALEVAHADMRITQGVMNTKIIIAGAIGTFGAGALMKIAGFFMGG